MFFSDKCNRLTKIQNQSKIQVYDNNSDAQKQSYSPQRSEKQSGLYMSHYKISDNSQNKGNNNSELNNSKKWVKQKRYNASQLKNMDSSSTGHNWKQQLDELSTITKRLQQSIGFNEDQDQQIMQEYKRSKINLFSQASQNFNTQSTHNQHTKINPSNIFHEKNNNLKSEEDIIRQQSKQKQLKKQLSFTKPQQQKHKKSPRIFKPVNHLCNKCEQRIRKIQLLQKQLSFFKLKNQSLSKDQNIQTSYTQKNNQSKKSPQLQSSDLQEKSQGLFNIFQIKNYLAQYEQTNNKVIQQISSTIANLQNTIKNLQKRLETIKKDKAIPYRNIQVKQIKLQAKSPLKQQIKQLSNYNTNINRNIFHSSNNDLSKNNLAADEQMNKTHNKNISSQNSHIQLTYSPFSTDQQTNIKPQKNYHQQKSNQKSQKNLDNRQILSQQHILKLNSFFIEHNSNIKLLIQKYNFLIKLRQSDRVNQTQQRNLIHQTSTFLNQQIQKIQKKLCLSIESSYNFYQTC